MILINLLPHREERRQLRRKAFFAGLCLSALVGGVIVILWYVLLGQMIDTQKDRNGRLSTEIAKFDAQIKDISTLKAEIEGLKARQQAVEDLQTDRNLPVHLLNELVIQSPEGVYLTTIRQKGQVVSVSGVAQTNERVSEFLRNTAYHSPWLERPELVEIKLAALPAAGRDPKRLFEFSINLTLKRPAPEVESGAPRSRPVGAAAQKS